VAPRPKILALARVFKGACNGVSYAFRLDQPAVLAWIRSWITN
jgi:hypothetical protein